MEIKVNKDINEYKSNIYMGFTLRQGAWLLAAGCVCVPIYLSMRSKGGSNMPGWLCILVAVPFILMGFFNYHGLTFDKFVVMWIRNKIITPHRLPWKEKNLYAVAAEELLTKVEEEEMKNDLLESKRKKREMKEMRKKGKDASQLGTQEEKGKEEDKK